MRNRTSEDSLAETIEAALCLGKSIGYNQSREFIGSLEGVKKQLDGLLADGQARRACELYEIFLAGCHEKAEEIHDSLGTFDTFFRELFCGWIKARQTVGHDPAGTVSDILGWLDYDEHEFCRDFDGEIVSVLDEKEFSLYR